MNNTATMPHQGRNVKRIREILGIKQDALASDLDISQQAVSLMEQKETLDDSLIEKIALILGVPQEAIKNFNEEAAVNIISNTFENCSQPASVFYNSTINPLQELVKLHEEKIALYERMLKEKEEMMAALKKLIK